MNSTLDGSGFRLLKGIEVDILDNGALDQTPEMLAQLDVVVASVHSKLAMEPAAMTRRMVAAVSNPRTNVLGHCTGRMVEGERGKRAQSSFDAPAVFAACIAADVAVEINSRPERQDPPDDLLAARAGDGLPVLDRQRRARAGAAGLPGVWVRAGRGARCAGRADRQHVGAGAAAGVGGAWAEAAALGAALGRLAGALW